MHLVEALVLALQPRDRAIQVAKLGVVPLQVGVVVFVARLGVVVEQKPTVESLAVPGILQDLHGLRESIGLTLAPCPQVRVAGLYAVGNRLTHSHDFEETLFGRNGAPHLRNPLFLLGLLARRCSCRCRRPPSGWPASCLWGRCLGRCPSLCRPPACSTCRPPAGRPPAGRPPACRPPLSLSPGHPPAFPSTCCPSGPPSTVSRPARSSAARPPRSSRHRRSWTAASTRFAFIETQTSHRASSATVRTSSMAALTPAADANCADLASSAPELFCDESLWHRHMSPSARTGAAPGLVFTTAGRTNRGLGPLGGRGALLEAALSESCPMSSWEAAPWSSLEGSSSSKLGSEVEL
mmetsp:Transcript_33764/g.98232  ORF Transcript_33764/g.98232 Transcript_33764/m.98232 type:complete len:352 (-) Transcript_33764:99-1154(-)